MAMILSHRLKHYLKRTFIYGTLQLMRQEKAYWAWRLSGGMGITPHRIKQKTLLHYASRFSITTLVESGTYLGEMIDAVKRQFRTIYSIELDVELYESARDRFARLPHVILLQGDSARVLPRVLEQLHEPCLFWLDAHYSGGITARGDLETPVAQELRQILSHSLSGRHVILIDDARNFVGANDYPTLHQIDTLIAMTSPASVMQVKDDIIRIHKPLSEDIAP